MKDIKDHNPHKCRYSISMQQVICTVPNTAIGHTH